MNDRIPPMTVSSTGLRRIATERTRQVNDEGHSPADDIGRAQDLFYAASRYADLAGLQVLHIEAGLEKVARDAGYDFHGPVWEDTPVPFGWPASLEWKPQPDPTRNADRAGALLAAGIDALLAEQQTTPTKGS